MVEPLNVKNKLVLEPIGKMQVRIQYINNVEDYRKSYQSMLNMKIEQIQTIIESIETGKHGQTNEKLIVSMMGGAEESKVRTSFY